MGKFKKVCMLSFLLLAGVLVFLASKYEGTVIIVNVLYAPHLAAPLVFLFPLALIGAVGCLVELFKVIRGKND